MSASAVSQQLIPAERLRIGHVREPVPALRARPLDIEALARRLRTVVQGEVRFEAASRALYAQDASNYRRIPLGVVIPTSKDDVLAAISVCRELGAPIVSRGGGTSLAGQTVNEAVVLDFSKRMNRIVWLDPEARLAAVEPGVVCDELVEAGKPFGLTWGPQPATHSHCCFGGMLGNNCGGMRAQMNGIAVQNVEALDVVLYDGTRLHAGWMREEDLAGAIRRGGAEGALLSRLRALRDRWAERIRRGYPKIPRRVSGYNLDQLLPGPDGRFNLGRVLVGSEATLVTMLEATLQLLPDPPRHVVVVLGYRDIFEAAEAAHTFLDFRPLALEGMDDILRRQLAEMDAEHAERVKCLSDGKAWLMIELGAATESEARARAEALVRRAGSSIVDFRIYPEPAQQHALWEAREGGLGATAFVPGSPDAWPGWEDSAVAPERLGAYLRDLRRLYDSYDYHPALYGHFGMGLIHCRVPFDLYTSGGVEKFRRFMSDAADLVVSYGGSLSGEHGDGQARAELLVKMFGPELMEAMRELKAIFDPFHRMNPGKIVEPYPIVDHLRLGPAYRPAQPETHFRFPEDDGSLARATLRCVGIGRCRRKHGEGEDHHDVMCPSYMVTLEEEHSTRGRAHLLWEMLRRDGPVTEGWRDDGVKHALDLCLSCKGCKGDCPVNVDLATYKAEFLAHYWKGRLRPRHAYAFGYIDKWARLAARLPGLVNLLTQTPGASALMKVLAGISLESKIPAFAPQTFRAMFRRRGASPTTGGQRVVLWADTFNDHFFPDTLMAAVDVLEAAGYEVVVPPDGLCCGRPLYDFGMLDDARRYLDRVLHGMRPYLAERLPVVVLEPSCASVFKDELYNLMPDSQDAAALRDRTMLLSDLLAREAKLWIPPKLPGRALVQGHCHQKALFGVDSEQKVLDAIGLEHEVLEAGCCGMAGAFGFVEETHRVGVACGERALLPRVRSAPLETIVMANGFSCREQIAQRTERGALHLAEVMKLALDRGPGEAPEPRAEARIVTRRRAAMRASMLRAAIRIVAVIGTAIAGATLVRRRRRTSVLGRALRRALAS